VWRPAGQAPLSRRDPHPAQLTLQGSQRSGWRQPASFTMVLTAPTPTPFRGADRGEVVGFSVDAERTADGGAKCCPMVFAVIAHTGRRGPECSHVPRDRRGPRSIPSHRGGRGGTAPEQAGERVVIIEVADLSGVAPELAGSKRAAPEQGSSGRPVKKARVHSKM
jgi:hypothetical protein